MIYSFLAVVLVLVHLAFIVYVLFGALLILKWPRTFWLHLPTCLWGMTVEFTGWICPLTPLEIELRLLAREQGYSGSFIIHYMLPILYPVGLTREIQWILGGIVILINLIIYTLVLKSSSSSS